MSIKGIIRLVVTCSLTAYLFVYIVDLRSLIITLQKASLHYLIMAFALNMVGVFLCTGRWMLILRAKNITIDYFLLLKLYLSGIFYNTFFPGTIGGDVYKVHKAVHCYSPPKGSFIDFASSVFWDRFFGLLTAILTAIAVICFSLINTHPPQHLSISAPVLLIYIVGLILFFVPFLIRKSQKSNCLISTFPVKLKIFLDRLVVPVYVFCRFQFDRIMMVKITIISFLFYLVSFIGTPYCLLYSFDSPISYFNLLSFMPFLNLIVMIPISVGGLGIRESAYLFFLSFTDIPPEVSTSVGFIIFGITIFNGMIGAALDLFSTKM